MASGGAPWRGARWRGGPGPAPPYPQGVDLLGEHWLGTQRPAVVSHFETDDYRAVMEIQFTWQDVFEISVHPSVTPEEGLKIGPEALMRARAHLD